MSIHLGILTINNLRYLQETLGSIKSNSPLEILLIDNGSEDETKNWVASSNYTNILNPTNYGVAAGWNQILYWGLSYRDCEIIFILNNDIVLHPECMDKMIESVLENGKELISGLNIGSTPIILNNFNRPTERYSPAVNFCCFGVTPKTIKRIGMFDEGFKTAYYEDDDFHHRAQLEGIDDGCDMWAAFTHYGSRSIKEGGVKHEPHFTQNREYFRRKWGYIPGQESIIKKEKNNGQEVSK